MLARYFDPLVPFGQLRRELDHLLDNVPGAAGLRGALAGPFPAVNLWEDGDNLYAEAEVPGISMDGMDITVVGNQLTVGGRRQPIEGEGVCCHRQERGAGDFKRTIELPVEVDADRVEAVLKNGVLAIQLPKAAPARARKIVVKGK
jgi:HSP20 family protein